MAVKITSEAIVRTIKPSREHFTLDELNSHVEGWIEPLKVGPFWVMYKENSKESGKEYNQVASFFFDVPIYGTVLIVPPQQMPTEWELAGPEDFRYTADQIDAGFLTSLQNSLMMYRTFNTQVEKEIIPKEEWSYKPTGEIDENTANFFKEVYQTIIDQKNIEQILYEDEETIIRTDTIEDKIKTLQLMIDYFIEEEEYEKCAALKKYITEIEQK
jgi:hypothetical protein